MALASLASLDPYSKSGFPPDYVHNQRTFYSPVDDVHAALMTVAKSATVSLVIAMYGFDDDDLAAIVHEKIATPGCFVQLTLDKSQAGGVHEKALLAKADYPATSIAIGNSEKHAIMHMKLMVVDGLDLVSGSTNWSASGETRQDNQLTVTEDAIECSKARARIDAVHDNMLMQMAAEAGGTKTVPPAPAV